MIGPLAALALLAAPTVASLPAAGGGQITVSARQFKYNIPKQRLEYTGDPVRFTRGDARLSCKQLVAQLGKTGEVSEATCQGDVRFERGDKVVTCEKALYEAAASRLTCEGTGAGKPTIQTGQLTATPAVISVGMIKGGTRNNIIPPEVEMEGTIRAFDPKIRKDIHERIKKTATAIAESAGATAEVNVHLGVPVTYNDPKLTTQMTPTLERVVGQKKIMTSNQVTGGEDFAFYQEKIPGLFFFLGITPAGRKPVPNHSPYFLVDESALIVGVLGNLLNMLGFAFYNQYVVKGIVLVLAIVLNTAIRNTVRV